MPQIQRDQTIDIAKGIAIIAIVLGHVLRGMGSAGLVDPASTVFVITDKALYMSHLTVFAFLSGLFVARGVQRDGDKGYLANRLTNFVYLYVIWQILQVLVKLGTASLVNSAPDVTALVQIWKPEGQMWFMPWLMIATTIAVVARPWAKGALPWVGGLAVVTLSLAAWANEGSYVGTQGLSLLVFFMAGSRVQFYRLTSAISRLGAALLGTISLMAAALYALLITFSPALPPTINASSTAEGVLFGIVASTIGLVLVLSISGWLARASQLVGRFNWLAFLGIHSLEIFLAHIIAASGTRIILAQLGVSNPTIHIVFGMVAGLIVPLLLWWGLNRIGWNWLFQRPRPSRTKAVL